LSVVDLAEWTWTLVAIGGLSICSWALIDGYVDRQALRASATDGLGATVVHMNLRSARASALLHAFFLALGILALLTPNPPVSRSYVILASAYILVAFFNARAIGLNQLDRLKMRRQ